MALEQLPVDARPVVVALEVAERAELDQVAVARRVVCQERQVRVPLVCARRSSTTYTSQPNSGFTPCFRAAR